MEKILSIVLIVGLLLTGTVVFAAPGATAASDRIASKSAVKSKLSGKLQNAKNWVTESKPLLEEIRSNKTKFAKLKAESKSAYNEAKKKIKEMLKNKDSLTPEQIEAAKQAVSTLANDKKQLGNTLGNIGAESALLRDAKRNKDIEAYKQALNNIISIQSTRINNLQTIIDDMNKIAAL